MGLDCPSGDAAPSSQLAVSGAGGGGVRGLAGGAAGSAAARACGMAHRRRGSLGEAALHVTGAGDRGVRGVLQDQSLAKEGLWRLRSCDVLQEERGRVSRRQWQFQAALEAWVRPAKTGAACPEKGAGAPSPPQT